eukprot:TRINITY_DN3905_c0_g1_i1.p2 TRINITY_DN3905_c0_g1~~TRINITY_DN3905_c0_g1_i1.p2  ORF type:complete len:191 (-),score=10.34 TRINITY_DN3905_c0_g1_i1:317-841(-)
MLVFVLAAVAAKDGSRPSGSRCPTGWTGAPPADYPVRHAHVKRLAPHAALPARHASRPRPRHRRPAVKKEGRRSLQGTNGGALGGTRTTAFAGTRDARAGAAQVARRSVGERRALRMRSCSARVDLDGCAVRLDSGGGCGCMRDAVDDGCRHCGCMSYLFFLVYMVLLFSSADA